MGIGLWPERPGFRRRRPAFGNRRGDAPAPCVPRQWCVRTPWPVPPLTTKPHRFTIWPSDNHLSVAAPQLRICSFPPGYEGVGQLSAYLILPFLYSPEEE